MYFFPLFFKFLMLGQGQGLAVNAQASPKPGTPPPTSGQLWLHPSPRGPGLVTVYLRNVCSFFLLLTLSSSPQPAKHQHQKLCTSAFCWPPAPGGKAKGTQKPVNKSANKHGFISLAVLIPAIAQGWLDATWNHSGPVFCPFLLL